MGVPSIPGLEKLPGSVTVTGVAAGGTAEATITLSSRYIIVGVPEVSTPTANATVELINGGKNKFTVRVTNSDAVAKDVQVDYVVYVVREV